MKPESIQIIPALQGFYSVVENESVIEVSDQIIAWRVETFFCEKTLDMVSSCRGLTIEGDLVSNCIGILNPDKTVTVFEDSTYPSIENLQNTRNPKI